MLANGVRVALLAGLAVAAQQEPAPRFKAGSSGVVVDAIVTDAKGRPVTGLAAESFRVFEDNVPQRIASFVPPGAPVKGAAARLPPQRITLVLDTGDLHPENLKSACAAAARFAERAAASGHSVAVYWIDTGLHLGIPFTRNAPAVAALLDKLSRRPGFARFGARERERTENEIEDLFVKAYPMMLQGPAITKAADASSLKTKDVGAIAEAEAQEEALREANMLRSWLSIAAGLQARTVFVALRAMSMAYRDLPGRKSVILFSEGFLHSPDAAAGLQGAIDAANRANVSLYAVDAAGADPGMRADTTGAGAMGGRATQDFTSLGPNGRAMGLNQFDWMQTLGTDAHTDLEAIAAATGGFLVKNQNDLGPALDRVVEDSARFYTLVYHPANGNYDGAFRKIRVEVEGRGLKVRHRLGYWAVPPGRDILMTPAAAQLLASAGGRKPAFVPVVNAAIVPAADGRFAVATGVSIPGTLAKSGGASLVLVARDGAGQLLGVHEGHADFSPAGATALLNLQGHVVVPELKPVTVEAFVGLNDGTLGWSPRQPIEPPAGSGLRLSGLLLSDQTRSEECAEDLSDPLCVKGVRLFVPAQPRFSRSGKMIVYAGLTGLKLDRQQPSFDAAFRLQSDEEVVEIQPEEVQASRGLVPGTCSVMVRFDLRKFKPGRYALQMIVVDHLASAQASETTEFELQ